MYLYNFLLRVIPCVTLVLILATLSLGRAYERSAPSPQLDFTRATISESSEGTIPPSDEGMICAYPFLAQPLICLACPVAKPGEIDNSELAIVQHFIDCLRLGDDSRATALLSSYPRILDRGSILESDSEGLSFAHLAAAHGNLSTLKYILTLKPELTYYPTQDNATILHQAALHKQLATVRFLCKKFSPLVTEVDYEGNTVLHIAARKGDVAVFKFLADRFPDLLLTRDNEGSTPLLAAAYEGQLAIVNLALHGFSAMIGHERNEFGHTMLHCLFSYYSQNIPLEAGVLNTIAHFCRLYPEALIMKSTRDFTVNYDSDPSFIITEGSTPYSIAIETGRHELAQTLKHQYEHYLSAPPRLQHYSV